MFATSKEAKEAGYFSRRHQTAEPNINRCRAREDREAAKLKRAQQRSKEAARRTPQKQLQRLDERLGIGVGAEKERARLKAVIDTVYSQD